MRGEVGVENALPMYAVSMTHDRERTVTHVVSRFHVALPSELLRIDVKMPALYIDMFFGTSLHSRILDGPKHGCECLWRVLRMQILRVDMTRLAIGYRGRARWTLPAGNKHVLFDCGWEHAEERVVDVLADEVHATRRAGNVRWGVAEA